MVAINESSYDVAKLKNTGNAVCQLGWFSLACMVTYA